jgi:hypothetical protein
MKAWPIIFSVDEIAGLVDGGHGETSRLISGQWRNVKSNQDAGLCSLLWVREPFGEAFGSIQYHPFPCGRRAIYLPRWASRYTLVVTHARHVNGKTIIRFRSYEENIDKFTASRRIA